MAIPDNVEFDRYAEMTTGLDSITSGEKIVVDGIALVTGWLSGGLWQICVAVAPSNSWAACYSDPTTTWTVVE